MTKSQNPPNVCSYCNMWIPPTEQHFCQEMQIAMLDLSYGPAMVGQGQTDSNPRPQAQAPLPTLLERFDKETASITLRRGAEYGHPADDFQKVTKMVEALPFFADPCLRHIAYMFCVKLARLAQTPNHVDSLIDIAGYARCWAMILDRQPVPRSNTHA